MRWNSAARSGGGRDRSTAPTTSPVRADAVRLAEVGGGTAALDRAEAGRGRTPRPGPIALTSARGLDTRLPVPASRVRACAGGMVAFGTSVPPRPGPTLIAIATGEGVRRPVVRVSSDPASRGSPSSHDGQTARPCLMSLTRRSSSSSLASRRRDSGPSPTSCSRRRRNARSAASGSRSAVSRGRRSGQGLDT